MSPKCEINKLFFLSLFSLCLYDLKFRSFTTVTTSSLTDTDKADRDCTLAANFDWFHICRHLVPQTDDTNAMSVASAPSTAALIIFRNSLDWSYISAEVGRTAASARRRLRFC